MTKILLILTILCCSYSYCQSIDESELIGLWKVVNVEGEIEVQDAQEEMLNSLKTAFKESTFEFESDKNFTLDIDFIGIEDMMRKVHWTYFPENSTISIQDWKLVEPLMEIIVEKKNDRIYFKLAETQLVLEVQK